MVSKSLLAALLASSIPSTFAEVNGSDVGLADTRWPSQWIKTNQGATIRVLVQGHGPTITILPSLSRDSGVDFDNVTLALVDAGYLVLRPQPRGALGSTGAMTNVTQSDLSNDIIDVIDTLGGGCSIFLGHASGSRSAQRIAAMYPDKIPGIVLAARSSDNIPESIGSLASIAANTSLPDSERLQALETGFFAPGHNASIWLEEGYWPSPQTAMGASSESADLANSTQLLEIIAKEDPFRPASSYNETIATYGAQRVQQAFIDDASHALFPEQPEAVAEAVLAWLEQFKGGCATM